jgi:hypothetical protein
MAGKRYKKKKSKKGNPSIERGEGNILESGKGPNNKKRKRKLDVCAKVPRSPRLFALEIIQSLRECKVESRKNRNIPRSKGPGTG